MYISAIAYSLLKNLSSKIVILKDNTEIDNLFISLKFFSIFFKKKMNVEQFYSYEIPPVSSIPPSSNIVSRRIKSLYSLINGEENLVFLTDINAILQPVMREEDFFDKFMSIHTGDEIKMEDLIKELVSMHYTKKDFVEEPGDFAKRGYIVDIFSHIYDKPLRIEFFSDEVESIKLFYIANKKTFKYIDCAHISPACEYEYRNDNYGYLNVAIKKPAFLVDYDSINKLSVYKNFDEDFINSALSSLQLYKDSYNCDIFLNKNRLWDFLKSSTDIEEFYDYSVVFADNLSIDEKILRIKQEAERSRVVIACASNIRLERVDRFLRDKGIIARRTYMDKNGVYLSDGFLKKGFFDKKNRIAFVSFEDLFGKTVQVYTRKRAIKSKTFELGGKVVHKSYGIGIYRGIKKLEIESELQDFIEIEYAKKDKLYVPVYSIDNVFEYHGAEELSSLSSSKWKKTQDSIKKSVKKILTELVNTYAKRQLVQREPFIVDTVEYREFEAMFEYEETHDQMRAIEDIENDMGLQKPMDRLICGDVSFGKTEVAMRAAAISVFNNRQVVFVVPTTVLSIQHYKTLIKRFEQFPVNIAILNRFSTKKEREDVLSKLKRGTIDILISTHSIYSDKVEFANLGLAIIDEEHRFGVKIKEHLKSKYPTIDMLYLSATPIPRTLNMALNNIFDISIIKTPPLERKPIETFVLNRKQSVIKDAILKELSRKGSVYFVHNDIETIEGVKDELDRLVPFAKKTVMHAKMPNKKIKGILDDFNNGKFEILIATSIIESGLNIKNVNTIIIDNADRFGLADLYQLRGRVGRGGRVAYAYLLKSKNISENAKKRLRFMKEFVERGIGFNLALKDMEIRGGGNILGKDQSGKIKSVGFETYASLIEEAIGEIKNKPVERDVEIKCSFDAYISDDFANDENRFAIYKMIYSAKTCEELEIIQNEISDEFGALPNEVKNLFLIAYLKIVAKRIFVKSLSLSKRGVLIEFYMDADIDTDKLIKTVEEYEGRFISNTSVFFDKLGNKFDEIYIKLKNILQKVR